MSYAIGVADSNSPPEVVIVVSAVVSTSWTCMPCVVFVPRTATHTVTGISLSPACRRPKL